MNRDSVARTPTAPESCWYVKRMKPPIRVGMRVHLNVNGIWEA